MIWRRNGSIKHAVKSVFVSDASKFNIENQDISKNYMGQNMLVKKYVCSALKLFIKRMSMRMRLLQELVSVNKFEEHLEELVAVKRKY